MTKEQLSQAVKGLSMALREFTSLSPANIPKRVCESHQGTIWYDWHKLFPKLRYLGEGCFKTVCILPVAGDIVIKLPQHSDAWDRLQHDRDIYRKLQGKLPLWPTIFLANGIQLQPRAKYRKGHTLRDWRLYTRQATAIESKYGFKVDANSDNLVKVGGTWWLIDW